MKRSIYSFVAVLLVISLSGVALASNAAAAMLRSNGGVSVNGSPVNSVTTVFAGDRIETAPQAGASLTVNGSSLLMDANSSMLFSGDEMNFYCGGGTIQTAQGLSARFGRMAVKPAKGTARFQVQQSGAELRVSALDGDLSVFDGEKTINLTPGNSASVPNLGCGQLAKNIPQDIVNNSVNNVPNAPPNSPPVASAPTTGTHVWTRGMLAAPSAVMGVAVTGIILIQQHPVSPSGP
jgi:hypothetical protein